MTLTADLSTSTSFNLGPARALSCRECGHETPLVKQYVKYGASPRGLQALILGGKVRALLDGRYNVSLEDLQQVAAPALRHRMILNFEGEAEEVKQDAIVKEIVEKTAVEGK